MPDKAQHQAREDAKPMPPARGGQAALWTLLVLTIVAIALLAAIVKPFAAALFVAAVLAGAIHPGYENLATRLRGRRQIAAIFTTIAVVLVVVLPLIAVSVTVVRELTDGVAYVRKTLRSEGVEGLVNDLPAALQAVARRALSELPDEQGMQDMAQRQGGRAAAAVGGMLSATWGIIFQLVLMLIAFYFFLVDGPGLVHWLADILPLRRGQTEALISDFRKVSVAVIVSSLATAAIQAAVAFIGYLIARVPSPFFFAIVTLLVGLVPALGASAVALVAAGLLYVSGHPMSAVFLAVWAVGPVGLIDNLVKPYLIRGGVQLHGAVVFFALIGGIAYFGAIGLIAGPLIVSFFLAVVRMWHRDEETP
jgi:predicted PurR-regulated permease PerM